jgi:hypothetical protein
VVSASAAVCVLSADESVLGVGSGVAVSAAAAVTPASAVGGAGVSSSAVVDAASPPAVAVSPVAAVVPVCSAVAVVPVVDGSLSPAVWASCSIEVTSLFSLTVFVYPHRLQVFSSLTVMTTSSPSSSRSRRNSGSSKSWPSRHRSPITVHTELLN